MNENETKLDISTNPNVEKVDYISAIKNLKERSVNVDDYNQVVEENKQLLNALTSERQLEQTDQEVVPTKAELISRKNDLCKSLYDVQCDLSNLDYWKNTLELRDIEMQLGNPDPFLPTGEKAHVTEYDVAGAEKVVEAVNHCIEYADGDSQLFTQELQRIMSNR